MARGKLEVSYEHFVCSAFIGFNFYAIRFLLP